MKLQDTRLVSNYKANVLERDAAKFWDLFYKRNETRFFKDRHWTTREFEELLNDTSNNRRVLLEIGCGVGNFIFPLLNNGLNLYIKACDFSPRAVEFVKMNPNYDEQKMQVFCCDITKEDIYEIVEKCTVDIVTLVFVLSAIHPDNFNIVLNNAFNVLKPGGILLFRDYGLYDMAQIRFKAGHKIAEKFYMRQDGTRTYYFSLEEMEHHYIKAGFKIISHHYIHRRTINKKENIDVPRIYVQSKLMKPGKNFTIKHSFFS